MSPAITRRLLPTCCLTSREGRSAWCVAPKEIDKEHFFQRHAMGMSDAIKQVPISGRREPRSPISISTTRRACSGWCRSACSKSTIGAWRCRRSASRTTSCSICPDEALDFAILKAAVIEVRDFLAELGFKTFLKATGGKGLHVVAPLTPKLGWDEVKGFAKAVADALATARPDRYTANMAKKVRTGQIFVDYLRNQRGGTAICNYSTRARNGATVAVPLRWDELKGLTTAAPYTVKTLPARLKRLKRDPWEAYFSDPPVDHGKGAQSPRPRLDWLDWPGQQGGRSEMSSSNFAEEQDHGRSPCPRLPRFSSPSVRRFMPKPRRCRLTRWRRRWWRRLSPRRTPYSDRTPRRISPMGSALMSMAASPVSIDKIETLDADSGALLGTLEGDGLAQMLRLNGGAKGTELPAASGGFVFMDLVLPEGAAVPRALKHRFKISVANAPEAASAGDHDPAPPPPQQLSFVGDRLPVGAPAVVDRAVRSRARAGSIGGGCCDAITAIIAARPCRSTARSTSPSATPSIFVQLDDKNKLASRADMHELTELRLFWSTRSTPSRDGTVVAKADDRPEQVPGKLPARHAASSSPLGNYVVIDIGAGPLRVLRAYAAGQPESEGRATRSRPDRCWGCSAIPAIPIRRISTSMSWTAPRRSWPMACPTPSQSFAGEGRLTDEQPLFTGGAVTIDKDALSGPHENEMPLSTRS